MISSNTRNVRSFYLALISFILVVACSEPEIKHDPNVIIGKEDSSSSVTAVNVKTEYISQSDGPIAYRKLGTGDPIVLCNRFRGILDDWDPKFIDELAKDYTVITFDYRGIGLSEFRSGQDSLTELQDVEDLAESLGLRKFSLLGWSHGGKVAQVFTAQHMDRINKLILVGTGPIATAKFEPEKIFFDYALKPVNTFEDEIVLFFEPRYPESVEAAKASHQRMKVRSSDTSKYVSADKFEKYFKSVAKYNSDKLSSDSLFKGTIPILAISGEHDIVFPVEDWYVQTKKNPNLQIIMLPKAGHGPQSQYPLQAARYIDSFLKGE